MTAVQTTSFPSGGITPQQNHSVGHFIQEPPLPPHIQWPPFVPAAPRQIDCVLYTVTLAPTAMRPEKFDQELSEYLAIREKARAIERSLLEEHQLMMHPPFLKKRDGSSDYQWKRPANVIEVMAERDARIRRLEHAQLDLRLRRARLEVSLLEAERIASQERMKESLLRIKSLSSSTSSTPSSIPTIGTSSLLYLPGTPTSPPTAVAHQPASKGLRVNRPDTSRKRSL